MIEPLNTESSQSLVQSKLLHPKLFGLHPAFLGVASWSVEGFWAMVQNLAQLLAARNAAKASNNSSAQPAASSSSARSQPAASSNSARSQPAVAPAAAASSAPPAASAAGSSASAAAAPNSKLHRIYGRSRASPKSKPKAKPNAEPKAETDPKPRKRPASRATVLKRPSTKRLKTPENVDGDEKSNDALDPNDS